MVRRLFNLYAGEGLKAAFFALIALFSSFGAMGGATLLDGQFLEHLGPDFLPLTYFWTAGALFCAASGLLWGLGRFAPQTLFSSILLGIALFYGVASFVGERPVHPYCWIVLKVVADASLLMILTSLWTVIDRAYDLQDAKRLFGLFSASLILGAAAGSGWVAVGLPRVGVGGLAASFGVAMVAACLLSLRCRAGHESAQEEPKEEVGWRPLLQQVLSSRFTLYLLLFNILLGLIEVVCEFDYMSTLTATLGDTGGTVTRFLGKARGWVYVGDMAFGMFLYSRLIKRIGINNASLCSAGYFLTLFVAGPPLNGLFIAILGLIAVEGILPVLEDSNFNLLLNAVPKGVKTRFRVVVEYFLQPIGILCGSLLLALFQTQAKFVGLALAILAVGVALLIRRRYPRAIYDNLTEEGIFLGPSTSTYLGSLPPKERKRLPTHLLARIPELSRSGQVAAVECLIHLSAAKPLTQLIEALGKLSEGAVPAVLELLERTPLASHDEVLEAAGAWAKEHRSSKCKGASLLFLAKRGRFPSKEAQQHLISSCRYLRSMAILKVLSDENHPQGGIAYTLLRRLVTSHKEGEVAVGLQLLGCLGTPRDIAFLSRFLRHPSPKIASVASRVLGEIGHLEPTYLTAIAELFGATSDEEVRLACLDALEGRLPFNQIETVLKVVARLCPLQRRKSESLIMQLGQRAIPVLERVASDMSRDYPERICSCRVLAQLGEPLPMNLLSHEIEQAAFYFYHYHTCDGTLQDLLWRGYSSSVDFVVHLLCASEHNADLLCRALRSGDEKTHSHAVETVEKRCPPKLAERIFPLIDDRPLKDKLQLYRKRGGRTLTTADLLAEFASSSQTVERLMAEAMLSAREAEPRELVHA